LMRDQEILERPALAFATWCLGGHFFSRNDIRHMAQQVNALFTGAIKNRSQLFLAGGRIKAFELWHG